MKVMHDLPIFNNGPQFNNDVKNQMMFVLDVIPENDYDESSLRYGPSNVKINEPPKVVSLYKETGLDYFSPSMKYRGF